MIQTIFCAQLHLIPTCTSHPTLQTYSAGCITTELLKWIRTVIRKRCEKMGWWAKVRKGTIGSFLKLGGDNCKHLQSLCLVILICFILCCKCGPFYLPFPLFSVAFLFASKNSQRKEDEKNNPVLHAPDWEKPNRVKASAFYLVIRDGTNL